MRRGKRVPVVILGLLVVAFVALTGPYFFELMPVSNRGEAGLVLGYFSIVLLFFILIGLLISGKRRYEQTMAMNIQREIEGQLRLIDRNRRGSQSQREMLVNDIFGFVEALNQFISGTTYNRTKRSLLEARQEFSELKVQQVVVKGRASKKRQGSLKEQLQLESDLAELTLNKLAEMTIVVDDGQSTDDLGKDQLVWLIDEKSSYFDQEYQGLSSYFGSVTTLVTYLNHQFKQGNITKQTYDHQLGILRHHFTRNDLLILFLYILIMPSGCRLGVELVGTSFFGDLAEVGQNTFVEVPEIFRVYLEEVFAKDDKIKANRHKQKLIGYFYEARQLELTKSYRNRKTAINRVLSGEYYVKNENGQPFLSLVDKLNLYG